MDESVVLQQILGQLTRIGDALQLQQELAVDQNSKMENLLSATSRMGSALQNVKRVTGNAETEEN
jgi:hypothetical protein